VKGIDVLFSPKSIAVIGASTNPSKLGHVVLKNIITSGYPGKIYPVNPKADEILGYKVYKSISEIPDPVDLAVIVIPAKYVNSVVEECGKKKVPAIIVITAGFKEVGHEGLERELKLKELCKKYNIAALGPNCLGMIDTATPYNASFADGHPKKGNIAFASQSGAMMTGILDWSLTEGIGFSKFISLGNKAVLNETDFIEALGNDEHTRVILMYIEDIVEGRRFLKVAKEVTLKKPVIVIKSGVTAAGAKAATSHTGSLAGSDVAYETAFKQTGVLRAETINELFDLAIAFSTQPIPKGNKVAIITNAGGPGIVATDACEKSGLHIAKLSDVTKQTLREHLPPAASVNNPVDVLGTATAKDYAMAAETVLKDESVDMVLVILTPQAVTEPVETAKLLSEIHKKYPEKPIFTAFMGGIGVKESDEILTENKIPCFDFPERAISGMAALYEYKTIIERTKKETYPQFIVDKAKVEKIIQKVREDNRVILLGHEAHEITRAYGIDTAIIKLARTPEEAVKIANELGYPVVMKISSPQIVHKSDIGGVVVGVNSDKEVVMHFEEIMNNVKTKVPNAKIYGIDIQKMLPKGRELIVGMSKDPQFGPLIMFGLGGIYVNFLKDVSFRLAPLSKEDAYEMINETKAGLLLKGVRGEKPGDIDATAETILRISQLVLDFPEIAELDINPLFGYDKGSGTTAVDVKITLTKLKD